MKFAKSEKSNEIKTEALSGGKCLQPNRDATETDDTVENLGILCPKFIAETVIAADSELKGQK